MNPNSYRFDWPYVTSLVERGEYEHPEVLKTIDAMCEVVWGRYFNFPSLNQMDREDMIQEGRIKSMRALNSGYFDSKYSLRNFLYTAIRNEMQNWTVKAQKNPLVGAENFDFEILADNASYEEELVMEPEVLADTLARFPAEYQAFGLEVAYGLQERGFVFPTPLPPNPSPKLTFRGREIVSKLECICIWQKMASIKRKS